MSQKKQKLNHPPAFWDNLSKIHLTKCALNELDRRLTPGALDSRPSQALAPAITYIPHCRTKNLKNIKQTAKHGGPDLSDLRGYREPSIILNQAMSSIRSSSHVPKRSLTPTPKLSTNPTTSIGPYNRNFQQNLIDGGVYPEGYEYPDGRVPPQPDNWEEIIRRLSQRRPSLSPSKFSDVEFTKFKRADAHALKEKQVTTSVIPIIEGNIGDTKCVSGGIPFANLDHLTDGTLIPGNPDIYYGARPEQLDRRVRNELSKYIIPSTQDDLPMAPNFFLEVKGPDGSTAVAKRQAYYNGALGARGIHSLQSYSQENLSYNNNTHTLSSIYCDGQLKMFTIYSSQPTSAGSRPEYFMHQLGGWSMTSDPETFRQGATYYRNGRDWAKGQRDEAIRRANEKVDEYCGRMLATRSFGPASSFTRDDTLGTDTIKALSQRSQTSMTEDPDSISHLQFSEPSSSGPSAKHSSACSKKSPQFQRKRRNAGHTNCDISEQSGTQSSEHSGLSQQFENQLLELDSQSGPDDLQQISLNSLISRKKTARSVVASATNQINPRKQRQRQDTQAKVE